MTPRTVSSAFNYLLADLKLTAPQRQLVNGRLRHLSSFFESYKTSRPLMVIGSYGRGTVIRRERDIDAMVVLAAKPY
jgi:tRNA nucleotidyltransferase (CCA-adding enzyme)